MSYSPIKDMEMLIFRELINVDILLGKTTFINICHFVAPNDFNYVI